MSNIVVIGAQWGDEGKGKIVDMLAGQASLIVRFQGGNNAGHTLVVEGEQCILHLIPSGILHPGSVCAVGNGVVLDPEVFTAEMDRLAAKGVDASPERLKVSHKTHLIMPYHKLLDAAREGSRSEDGKIGTTGRGIGPCYEDKMSRVGLRAGDFLDTDLMRRKIEVALVEKNALLQGLYGQKPVSAGQVMDWLKPLAARIAPHLADVSGLITDANDKGDIVLFEGAQGTHLDIDHGTYPYVTSSSTVSGNAAGGAGLGPRGLTRIIAIVKAYTTRVGGGPFATELFDADGDHLQATGGEFGATTGRKRRCGWLDLPLLRESVRLNTPTEIALTKLDVLAGLPELKICTAYRYQGKEVLFPPQAENAMAYVEPVYDTHPGWNEDISQARTFAELPKNAQTYVQRIEQALNTPITLISIGPDREQVIMR